jgi:hypothetical protein
VADLGADSNIPELARLLPPSILANCWTIAHRRLSNGPIDVINLLIKKVKRIRARIPQLRQLLQAPSTPALQRPPGHCPSHANQRTAVRQCSAKGGHSRPIQRGQHRHHRLAPGRIDHNAWPSSGGSSRFAHGLGGEFAASDIRLSGTIHDIVSRRPSPSCAVLRKPARAPCAFQPGIEIVCWPSRTHENIASLLSAATSLSTQSMISFSCLPRLV